MKCPKCGKQNKAGVKTCVKCGEKIVKKKVSKASKLSKLGQEPLTRKKSPAKIKQVVKLKKTKVETEEKLEPTLKLELQSLIAATKNHRKINIFKILGKVSSRIWAISLSFFVFLIVIIYLLFGINRITCKYASKEDNLKYKSVINFRYKNNSVTSYKMKIEYYSFSNKYAKEFDSFYDNIIGNLENLDNFQEIIKASKGIRHFSVVYTFGNKYLDQVFEYTGFELNNYDNINDLIKEIELSGFECN